MGSRTATGLTLFVCLCCVFSHRTIQNPPEASTSSVKSQGTRDPRGSEKCFWPLDPPLFSYFPLFFWPPRPDLAQIWTRLGPDLAQTFGPPNIQWSYTAVAVGTHWGHTGISLHFWGYVAPTLSVVVAPQQLPQTNHKQHGCTAWESEQLGSQALELSASEEPSVTES